MAKKKLTKADKYFLFIRRKHNNRIVASYLALYAENKHLKKAMVTFTPKDSKLSTTIEMKKDFIEILSRYKRLKNGDTTVKYFSNIEFTKNIIPHIHIQLFYTSNNTILKAYNYVLNKHKNNFNANSIIYAINNNLIFTYVIKDYLYTDLTMERTKQMYNVKYISSSRKSLNLKIIKYLYRVYTFKTNIRYIELLNAINKGIIVIKKHDFKPKPKRALSKYGIGQYCIIIFKEKTKKPPYKIKRLIKNQKAIKIKMA